MCITKLYVQMPEKDINKKLHEFRQRYYTSDNMVLSIMARESIQSLERKVVKAFSGVPRNRSQSRAANDRKRWNKPYSMKKFHRLFRIKSIQDVYEVEMVWVLPCLTGYYEEEPMDYLTWCIGHEGR